MVADSKEVLHQAVHGQEPLRVGGRLETSHLVLALAGRLVGDFGAIVRVLVRAAHHGRLCQLNEGCAKFGGETRIHASSAGTRHRLPREEGLRSQHPVVNCAKQMSADSEQILDDAVHRCEAL